MKVLKTILNTATKIIDLWSFK